MTRADDQIAAQKLLSFDECVRHIVTRWHGEDYNAARRLAGTYRQNVGYDFRKLMAVARKAKGQQ